MAIPLATQKAYDQITSALVGSAIGRYEVLLGEQRGEMPGSIIRIHSANQAQNRETAFNVYRMIMDKFHVTPGLKINFDLSFSIYFQNSDIETIAERKNPLQTPTSFSSTPHPSIIPYNPAKKPSPQSYLGIPLYAPSTSSGLTLTPESQCHHIPSPPGFISPSSTTTSYNGFVPQCAPRAPSSSHELTHPSIPSAAPGYPATPQQPTSFAFPSFVLPASSTTPGNGFAPPECPPRASSSSHGTYAPAASTSSVLTTKPGNGKITILDNLGRECPMTSIAANLCVNLGIYSREQFHKSQEELLRSGPILPCVASRKIDGINLIEYTIQIPLEMTTLSNFDSARMSSYLARQSGNLVLETPISLSKYGHNYLLQFIVTHPGLLPL